MSFKQWFRSVKRRTSQRKTRLEMECLEAREVPATMLSPTMLTYQDIDGDSVQVMFSRPVLTAANVNSVFSFNTGNVNGSNALKQQLKAINLTGMPTAAGTDVSVTATEAGAGDGCAAVGQVDATGLDLHRVSIQGDLGRIRAGDNNLATPGLGSLAVNSLGVDGTMSGAPDLHTTIQGALGSLHVNNDVQYAWVNVLGGPSARIGKVTVGGYLLGGTDQYSGEISSSGSIGSLTIKGGIIGGKGDLSGRVFTQHGLGTVTIGGNLSGGAGMESGTISCNGSAGTVRIAGDIAGKAGVGSGMLTINGGATTVRIGGSLHGGSANDSGALASGGRIKSLAILGDIIGGDASGTMSLTETGIVLARRITTMTLGGSLIAGTDSTTGSYLNNGAIRVALDIGTLAIQGSLLGNATNDALITAGGSAHSTFTTDLAIGKLTVAGGAYRALVHVGVGITGKGVDADASIGSVKVGGDWYASSLAAGADAGSDGYFGDSDDKRITGILVKDVSTTLSRIGSLTVAGQVKGTVGGNDFYGIVAEAVGTVTIVGAKVAHLAGPHNDVIDLGATGDVRIREL
jgi:hypothetical protein